MKTAIFLIILAGLLQTTVAQTRVFTNFNSVHSGRSINVLASAQVKGRHEFGGGFRININKYAHNDDQNNIFKKRMFATKPIHYFGVEGFYNVHIFQKLKHIDLFAFYNVQVVYSTTRNRAFIPAFEHEGETYYTKHECTYGPFTWIEQNIGIGFTVDIWNNIFLSQRLGAGVCFILGKDYPNENKPYFLAKPPFSWEFGYLLSVGFGYRFEKKK
ncbi:hypothetical protein LJC68_08080 [Bacteroidales bacterium OttesenSCG-928-B11]|nr:hypothetical protein [Bacteroidales bacterium OttesenSCG-928-B11]MDL2326479.1 hypothetical protein [Bacteroidales bacterium OttesenSCG-928-A14]